MLLSLLSKKLLSNKCIEPFLLVFAGVIGVFAFAPYNLSACIVISILILLWIINKSSSKASKAAGYGFLYGFSYFSSQIYWMFYSLYVVIKAGFWISLAALLGFSAFLAIYLVLTVYLYTRLKTRSTLFNYVFLFPALWVFFEWIRGWFLGGFSWCDVGYTVVNTIFFRGYFATIGEYGVSWLYISLIGAVCVVMRRFILFQLDRQQRGHYRISIVYIAMVILIGYAAKSAQYTKPYGSLSSVALLQGNIGVDGKWNGQDGLQIYESMVKNTRADIVMLPETGISQFEMNLPKNYLKNLELSAKQNNASLIIGIPLIIDDDYNYINTAMLLTAPKHPYYAKYHLVPYGEYIPAKWLLGPLYKFIALPMVGFTPGAKNQEPLLSGNQKLAFNICFENGFGSELIYAAARSTIMVNLSDMVWYGTTVAMNQHLQLSQARALENQRYFIQETNTSITAIINPQGQIQSQLPVFRRGVLKDTVQGMIGVTPYERFGNYPIILWCSLIIAYALAWRKRNLFFKI
ncbi:MAG: Apolipoprotein N-acyltransferase [Pseudomonadota bacterium]|nr:Apolipoprotein N-acyltransferase [Pseudomonadota bacterium]